MLNVWSISGQLVLALPAEKLTDVWGLKRRLSSVCGAGCFQQRRLAFLSRVGNL